MVAVGKINIYLINPLEFLIGLKDLKKGLLPISK